MLRAQDPNANKINERRRRFDEWEFRETLRAPINCVCVCVWKEKIFFEKSHYELKHSPNKILAMRAERRLLEESRDEPVVFDVVNIFLFQRTFPAA